MNSTTDEQITQLLSTLKKSMKSRSKKVEDSDSELEYEVNDVTEVEDNLPITKNVKQKKIFLRNLSVLYHIKSTVSDAVQLIIYLEIINIKLVLFAVTAKSDHLNLINNVKHFKNVKQRDLKMFNNVKMH